MTENPNLASEWHPTKNGNLKPENATPKSGKRVWWKCSKCGTSFICPIKTRKNEGGCPQCANAARAQSKYKKIVNVETGVIFNSVQDAAKIMDIGRTSISACLQGKSKTAGGYHWKVLKTKD